MWKKKRKRSYKSEVSRRQTRHYAQAIVLKATRIVGKVQFTLKLYLSFKIQLQVQNFKSLTLSL